MLIESLNHIFIIIIIIVVVEVMNYHSHHFLAQHVLVWVGLTHRLDRDAISLMLRHTYMRLYFLQTLNYTYLTHFNYVYTL